MPISEVRRKVLFDETLGVKSHRYLDLVTRISKLTWAALALLMAETLGFSHDLTVTNLADSGPGTLRQAIADAVSGNSIGFSVTGTISVVSKLIIDKSLTIAGPGATNLLVEGETAAGFGGTRVFEVTSGPTTISGISIAGGYQYSDDAKQGATFSSAGLSLIACAFTNCHAYSMGAAVQNSGGTATLAVIGCTFEKGLAFYGAGAIANEGLLRITNCTFGGNSGYNGGAIINSGDAAIVSSTIARNISGNLGGGIFNTSGTLTLQNTIVADNYSYSPGAGDISGAISTGDHNLILDTNGIVLPGTHNVLGVDPLLSGLGNWGGPTRTCGLASTSPALDAADPLSSPSTDQRGVGRPVGTGFDIGAYEGALPENHPPAAADPLNDLFVHYGDFISNTLPVNAFSDPDNGQTLTLSMQFSSLALSFDPTTRRVTGTASSIGTNLVTIVATDNGAPSLSVSNSFQIVIAKVPITARADDQSRPFGQTNFSLSITYYGLVGPANIDNPPIPSTAATPASPPGNYPIVLTGGSDDIYEFVGLTNGTLTVNDFSAEYQQLHSFGFSNLVGNRPYGLVLGTDGVIYGFRTDALTGGQKNESFRINQDGTGYMALPQNRLGIEGSDGFFYGTKIDGGTTTNLGMLYKVRKDGSDFQVLHYFTGGPDDGAAPQIPLVQGKSGILYGTAPGGGSHQGGIAFQIMTNGGGYAVIHNFDYLTEGSEPTSLLEGGDGILYGTTSSGGPGGFGFGNGGTVFKINPQDNTFALLYTFDRPDAFTGIYPGSLIEGSDGALYGVTFQDGPDQVGTIFRLEKSASGGSGYTLLHTFTLANDGHFPGALVKDGSGILYGTTSYGSSVGGGRFSGYGTVFSIHEDGTSYSLLASLGSVGVSPSSLLLTTQGTLYGACAFGGSVNAGTLFHLSTNGTDLGLLWSFNPTGGDGQHATAGMVEGTDGVLYGTTEWGGDPSPGMGSTYGIVYRVNKDGSGYQILHNFTGQTTDYGGSTTRLFPGSGGWLYGIANGTIFKVRTNGNDYTTIYTFTFGFGDFALVEGTDGRLYGVRAFAGDFGEGVVFSIGTDGTGYTNIYHFGSNAHDGFGNPQSLIQAADGTLYGTTSGGDFSGGTIFSLTTNGTEYTIVHQFGGTDGAFYPAGALMQDADGILFGGTSGGGSAGGGTIFRVNSNGAGFQVLRSFLGSAADGSSPTGPLVQGTNGFLYGTTAGSYASIPSTLFRIRKDGSDYCVLRVFGDGVSSGPLDTGGILLGSDGLLYGTVQSGGDSGFGAVFRIGFGPAIPNSAPLLANTIPDQSSVYGDAFNYTFPINTFNDPDPGQSLFYAVSNLPPGISFDSSTRTFSGTNTAAGNYPVTVTASDNGLPVLATNTTFNIAVGKAVLTARALDQTNTYGSFFFVNSYITVDYSGFKFQNENVFNLGSPPAISTTANSSSSVGTYPIHLTGGSDPHYDFALQDGVMTLVPAPLMVVVYNKCRLAAQANPQLSGRLVGLLNNDPITASYSTTATTQSPAGSYPISVTFGDSNSRLANYALNYIQGELTILPYDYSFEVIHAFGTNGDIASRPISALLEGPNLRLYGLTGDGGNLADGALYSLNKDGTDYGVVASFPPLLRIENNFGRAGKLVLGTNGLLYGVGVSTLFTVDTNGLNLENLVHLFSDEGSPNGPVLLSTNGLLYGTGSAGNKDTIYSIAQDGTAFTILWQNSVFGTNPTRIAAGLIEGSDGYLYGTSQNGGTLLNGTLFRLQKDGSGLTILHSFSDGALVLGIIECSDGMLYGISAVGGLFGSGSIYKIARDGTGYSVLHHFDPISFDGSIPVGSLVEANDGYLYGVTSRGGSSSGTWGGVAYRIKKDGSGYCILHNFGGPLTEPGNPLASLIQASDGSFYGTTQLGGDQNQKGFVFRIIPLIPPAIQLSQGDGQINISWGPPTEGYILQQNASLDSNTWTDAPTGNTNPVTYPTSSGGLFFRLIKR